MLKEILLPDLGEGIEAADVSEILVNSGDSVSVDDIILFWNQIKQVWKSQSKTMGS